MSISSYWFSVPGAPWLLSRYTSDSVLRTIGETLIIDYRVSCLQGKFLTLCNIFVNTMYLSFLL